MLAKQSFLPSSAFNSCFGYMLFQRLRFAFGSRVRWPFLNLDVPLVHHYVSSSSGCVPVPELVTEPGVSLRLREYQEDCIRAVLNHVGNGQKRLGISLATGSGKTVIFTHLIDRIEPPREDATQTLILVHRRELVEQAARHCVRAYPSKVVEIEMGNTHASGRADITIASILSITSKDRLAKFDPDKFKLVLVDEAHHIVAHSFSEALAHFRLIPLERLAVDRSPILVGVSATLSRFDGLRLSDAIDHIVYHKDYVDLIEEGWLSNVIFTTVKSRADISKVKRASGGDFQARDLSQAVNNPKSNEITVKAWAARAASRKSTLVFCVDLAHISDLTAEFRKHGFDARSIHGGTPKQDRITRLDAFKAGDFPILLSVGVFTEGTDIPNIDCVLLARPTRSRNLLIQMIGRGMRLFPGKVNCHVIDMVASLETGIVTTPTLFGLDPAEIVSELNVEDIKDLHKRKENSYGRESWLNQEDLHQCQYNRSSNENITFTDYDSVYSLIDDTSGERFIRGMSPLAWVMVGPNRFVLSSQAGSYLTIEKADTESRYHVIYTQKLPKELVEDQGARSPLMRPRRIAESENLSSAIQAADNFASKRLPWHSIHAGQPWRKRPATEGQIAFINRLRPMNDQLTLDMISKGKATDMISKVKFGAKGQFRKLESMKRRQEEETNQLRQSNELKQRESVRVGPTA